MSFCLCCITFRVDFSSMPSGSMEDAPSSPSSSVCSEIRAEEVWREAGEHMAMSKISEKVCPG